MNAECYQMSETDYGPFNTYDDYNTCLAGMALKLLNDQYFKLPKMVSELHDSLLYRPECRLQSIFINLPKLFQFFLRQSNGQLPYAMVDECNPSATELNIDLDIESKENITDFHSQMKNSSGHMTDESTIERLITKQQYIWLEKFVNNDENAKRIFERNESEQKRMKLKTEINSMRIHCILDVAHNSNGILSLFKSIEKLFPNESYAYRVVIAVNPKKNVKECCSIIAQYSDYIHLICAIHDPKKGSKIECLYNIFVDECSFSGNNIFVPDVNTEFVDNIFVQTMCAMTQSWISMNESKSGNANESLVGKRKSEIIIVFGSFYIMNDVRKCFGMYFDCDYDDLQETQIQKK